MKRILSTALLALSLALTGACTESQSGGSSNPDNQIDQAPGVDGDEPEAELGEETEEESEDE
jgi:hypothetical protein